MRTFNLTSISKKFIFSIFVLSPLYSQAGTGSLGASAISGISLRTFLFSSDSITKNKSLLDLCEKLKKSEQELKVKDENNKILNAYLTCKIDSNNVEIYLKVHGKDPIIYTGKATVSKMTDGALLISNEKFRVQFKILNKTEAPVETCNLVLYDILNNSFFNSEICKLKKLEK